MLEEASHITFFSDIPRNKIKGFLWDTVLTWIVTISKVLRRFIILLPVLLRVAGIPKYI